MPASGGREGHGIVAVAFPDSGTEIEVLARAAHVRDAAQQ